MYLPQVRAVIVEAGPKPTHLAEIKVHAPHLHTPCCVSASAIITTWCL